MPFANALQSGYVVVDLVGGLLHPLDLLFQCGELAVQIGDFSAQFRIVVVGTAGGHREGRDEEQDFFMIVGIGFG